MAIIDITLFMSPFLDVVGTYPETPKKEDGARLFVLKLDNMPNVDPCDEKVYNSYLLTDFCS